MYTSISRLVVVMFFDKRRQMFFFMALLFILSCCSDVHSFTTPSSSSRPNNIIHHTSNTKTAINPSSKRTTTTAQKAVDTGSSNSFATDVIRRFKIPSHPPLGILSSGLISSLAEVALKLRLKNQQIVSCIIPEEATTKLLTGRVGPVTVKGRGWGSQLGLTCRAIDATVGMCQLNIQNIIQNQKLVLETPAIGKAMVALDSTDFGNFITHPLLKPPSGEEITFSKNNVRMNSGSVIFYGSTQQEEYQFALRKDDNKGEAQIIATSMDTISVNTELSERMSDFFNNLIFELDGTYLKFQDMQLTSVKKNDWLMLQLNIKVHKFPSKGLSF
mmetsp:Transcript_13352/g.15310  ORF Transcript_13352/g.15310 Transcript_13352/m.15310 type:complete len:330 (+) Transcript_13352:92-1081(+)